jgi:hypothetical protein
VSYQLIKITKKTTDRSQMRFEKDKKLSKNGRDHTFITLKLA